MVQIKGLKRPNNPNLPYFAYGPFKPGQVGFPIIKYFVKDIKEATLNNYKLGQRNGIPILLNQHGFTMGYLLYFKDLSIYYKMGNDRDRKYYDAYDFIRSSKSISLYKWREVDIGNQRVNIMLAKRNSFGKPYVPNPDEPSTYDGKSNKMFYETLEYLYSNLKFLDSKRSFEGFVNLQMNYMFLWSSIDNFLSLGYGGWDQRKHIIEWSKWEEFRLALRNHVHRECSVKSTQNSKTYPLNREKPKDSILYYYQFRCNVVHSGKEYLADFSKLKKAYKELLYIFWDVLDLTFYGEIRY